MSDSFSGSVVHRIREVVTPTCASSLQTLVDIQDPGPLLSATGNPRNSHIILVPTFEREIMAEASGELCCGMVLLFPL